MDSIISNFILRSRAGQQKYNVSIKIFIIYKEIAKVLFPHMLIYNRKN